MGNFISTQIDYVYFVCGLSFLSLTGFCLILVNLKDEKLPWNWLGIFALAFGIYQWMKVFSISLLPGYQFQILRLSILLIAYIGLFQLAARTSRRFAGIDLIRLSVIISITVLIIAFIARNAFIVEMFLRFFIGLPCGLWAAFNIFSSRKQLGSLFASMALFMAGLAITQVAWMLALFLPITWMTRIPFGFELGALVQVMKTVIGAFLLFAIGSYYVGARKYKIKLIHRFIVAPLFILFLILGWLLTSKIGEFREFESKDDLLKRAITAAASVDGRKFNSLKGSSEDADSVDYAMLVEQVEKIHKVNPDCRYLYMMGVRDSKVYFYADSALKQGDEVSLPGDIYREASQALVNIAKNGEPFIEGPLPDEWGLWVSGFAPVRDYSNDKIVAVLGMDIDAGDWQKRIFDFRLTGILASIAVFILLMSVFVIFELNSINTEQLRSSEENLRSMVNNAPEGVFIFDVNSRKVLLANNFMCRLLGYSALEMLSFTLPDIVIGTETEMNSTINKVVSDKTVYIPERNYKKKDGTMLPAEVTGAIVKYMGHDCVMTFVRDITERKRIENMKDEFVSMVSHELRTPLAAIKESISLIIDGAAGEVNDTQKEFLGIGHKNVDRLGRLINDVLDFQKLRTGNVRLCVALESINSLAHDVILTMTPLANTKGIVLKEDMDGNLPLVMADADKITQVLTNLVNNSMKFTDTGSICISTKNMGQSTVRVSVTDTGIGIRPEDINRLFSSFSQVSAKEYRKQGGTGLGLAISKDIIEMHSGRIWVESEPGKGSVFHFELPVNGPSK